MSRDDKLSSSASLNDVLHVLTSFGDALDAVFL